METTTVYVFSAEEGTATWGEMPELLPEFIAWLAERLNEVPEEYQEVTKIKIDSTGGYDESPNATVEITYARPMTKEEIAERRVREENWRKQRVAEARRKYEELKAFFEPKE